MKYKRLKSIYLISLININCIYLQVCEIDPPSLNKV